MKVFAWRIRTVCCWRSHQSPGARHSEIHNPQLGLIEGNKFMTQTLRKLVTFDEFVTKYPDNSGKRYELHDGVVVEMALPTGDHEEVIGFLVFEITRECIRLNLSYIIPKTAFVKPEKSESAYSPDVLILNQPNLVNEPLWKKESTRTLA